MKNTKNPESPTSVQLKYDREYMYRLLMNNCSFWERIALFQVDLNQSLPCEQQTILHSIQNMNRLIKPFAH